MARTMSSYEELTPEMRQQVDATLANLKAGLFYNMDEAQRESLREHMSNTVMTCLSIDHDNAKGITHDTQ